MVGCCFSIRTTRMEELLDRSAWGRKNFRLEITNCKNITRFLVRYWSWRTVASSFGLPLEYSHIAPLPILDLDSKFASLILFWLQMDLQRLHFKHTYCGPIKLIMFLKQSTLTVLDWAGTGRLYKLYFYFTLYFTLFYFTPPSPVGINSRGPLNYQLESAGLGRVWYLSPKSLPPLIFRNLIIELNTFNLLCLVQTLLWPAELHMESIIRRDAGLNIDCFGCSGGYLSDAHGVALLQLRTLNI